MGVEQDRARVVVRRRIQRRPDQGVRGVVELAAAAGTDAAAGQAGADEADGNPVPGRPDDAQIDHVEPRVDGGHGGAHNGAVACRRCNRDKSTKTMEDWDDELRDFLDP
ncbi:HNH endonuclease [Streptomyces sp. CFMR 7]|uniref:HNH endonuclease n=1 Tax=Streptomyces sp. CFMR 7 TaxID=1649184 RepID=UPI0011A6A327